MNELTRQQAEALAAFIHTVRDDWGVPGIVKALGEARSKGTASDVAIAAVVAARDAANRTPAVIPLPGPHWAHTAIQKRPSGPGTPPASATCGTCYLAYEQCRRRWAGDHEFISITQLKERARRRMPEYMDGRKVEEVELP